MTKQLYFGKNYTIFRLKCKYEAPLNRLITTERNKIWHSREDLCRIWVLIYPRKFMSWLLALFQPPRKNMVATKGRFHTPNFSWVEQISSRITAVDSDAEFNYPYKSQKTEYSYSSTDFRLKYFCEMNILRLWRYMTVLFSSVFGFCIVLK